VSTLPAEALRFSSERFSLGGLAYDGVSHRFLVGDRLGRKVMVVGEGSNSAVDLVRSDSAGFHEISALAIDARRGDLWVASDSAGNGAGAVHRLQLVSGRPLRTYAVSAESGPVALVDLAVSPAGAVLVLDSHGRQVLTLRAADNSVERVVQIDGPEPLSIAVGDEEGIAYVAHREGLSRIDVRSKTAAAVSAPKGGSLSGLERIRWYRRALIAVQVDGDGSRHVVRLDLNASGRAVTKTTTLQDSVPAGRAFVTISGEELIYLTANSGNDALASSPNSSPGSTESVAYRIPLK
jgi:hypothetical protein